MQSGSVLVDDGANLLEQIPRGLLDDGLGAVDEIDRFRVFHASVRVDRIVGFRPPEDRKQKDVVFHVIGDSARSWVSVNVMIAVSYGFCSDS